MAPEFINKIRIIGFILLLFAVVAVDFVSSLMSMAFDAAIAGTILVVVWPLLFGNKSDKTDC